MAKPPKRKKKEKTHLIEHDKIIFEGRFLWNSETCQDIFEEKFIVFEIFIEKMRFETHVQVNFNFLVVRKLCTTSFEVSLNISTKQLNCKCNLAIYLLWTLI